MFKVEDVYVEDRRLGDLLKAMAGIVRGNPRPVPVANVEEGHTGMRAKLNGSNLVQVYAEYLAKTKTQSVTPTSTKKWLVDNGYSALSYSYIIKGIVSAGIVKKSGKGQKIIYTVQQAKP